MVVAVALGNGTWQWHLAMASYHSVRQYFSTCPSVIVASPKMNPHMIELLRSFFSRGFKLSLPGAGMTAVPSAPAPAPDADFDFFAVVFILYLGDNIIDPGSRRLAIAATASTFSLTVRHSMSLLVGRSSWR